MGDFSTLINFLKDLVDVVGSGLSGLMSLFGYAKDIVSLIPSVLVSLPTPIGNLLSALLGTFVIVMALKLYGLIKG